jgi:hypothetical protein
MTAIAQARALAEVFPPKVLMLETYPWLLKVCNW